jgi:hypothetical protein
MILAIPQDTLRFGFMFSYDVTKIIEEMPEIERYRLLRPNTRNAHKCRTCGHRWSHATRDASTGKLVCPNIPLPSEDASDANEGTPCLSTDVQTFTQSLRWRGRAYGFFNGSFTISAKRSETSDRARPWLARKGAAKRTVKIWDCFRFFGCSFVEALTNWKIGTEEQRSQILAMKNKRGAFVLEKAEDVELYCKLECHLLALMMRKVLDSHEKAEIPLTSYYGAGSTAGALLKKNEVADFRGPTLENMPLGLAHAISCAFFGGRFENSSIGVVAQEVHSYDISSAYPYAQTQLPCLACGRWRRVLRPTLRQIERASMALCKFRVAPLTYEARRKVAWCPLPFRDAKGSICYGTNFSGWAWREEIMSAIEGWGFVKLDGGAWLYDTTCKHRPFRYVPEMYRKRCEWGKEGPGIVMKLGINAGYGKTAQSIGDDPPYQCWPWAGATTGSTRGQLNQGIASAKDPWDVLALATDGIYARCELDLPKPRKTGTADLEKPLGGWEHKVISEGAFFAKPGLYFRLRSPSTEPAALLLSELERARLKSKELAEIRARGVGRREVYEQRAELLASFAAWDRKDFSHHLTMTSRRFYGAKHSISAYSGCTKCRTHWPGVPDQGCPKCGSVGDMLATTSTKLPAGPDGVVRDAYGTWSVRNSDVRFDPRPKRESVTKGGTSGRLQIRDLGGLASAPYLPGTTSPEGEFARLSTDFALEQPDWEESRITA